jgi:hypothetical protein
MAMNKMKTRAKKTIARNRAIERSAMFYGMAPRTLKRVFIKWPKALVHIGRLAQVNYVCDKFDGKMREYYHRFGRGCQIYTAERPQPDGTNILIIKGPFKIKPAGITG